MCTTSNRLMPEVICLVFGFFSSELNVLELINLYETVAEMKMISGFVCLSGASWGALQCALHTCIVEMDNHRCN